MHADVCQIFTDVDGVYTADLRIVKDARKLNDIYDEMLELASLGANVLHNRSVELALKYNVKLEVRSSFNKEEGTSVKEVSQVEKMLVRGVTRDNNTARISVVNIEDTPGKAFKIFSLLAKEDINVDVILQSIGRENTKDISFTVDKSNLEAALKFKRHFILGHRMLNMTKTFPRFRWLRGMTSNRCCSMFEALMTQALTFK